MSKRVKFAGAAATILALVVASVALAAPQSATISVTDSTSGLAAAGMSSFTSHFTAAGCGFRANDSNDYLVIRGPGLYTSGLTTSADHFPVDGNGCGSASPSWSGSGVTGWFDVYVVRSPSGNPWSAQPISNTVTIYISSP
jgi:hypothetical protein